MACAKGHEFEGWFKDSAAYDSQDIGSQKFPPVYYPSAIEEATSALRLGVARDFWNEVDGEIAGAVDLAVTTLSRVTTGVEEVELSTDTDRTLVGCEAYAYHQKYLPQHEQDYNPETLRRIRSGADVSAADYIKAQRELWQHRRQILQLFERIDLLLTPTTPVLAPASSSPGRGAKRATFRKPACSQLSLYGPGPMNAEKRGSFPRAMLLFTTAFS